MDLIFLVTARESNDVLSIYLLLRYHLYLISIDLIFLATAPQNNNILLLYLLLLSSFWLNCYWKRYTDLIYFPAFLDLSLKMYILNIHEAGYVKEQTEKGRIKEDQSYTHMCYDFILQNMHFDFIDIFWSFGVKPYLTANAHEICPQLPPLLRVWCYKIANEKINIKNVSWTFQDLIKSTGKALDQAHALKVLHWRDIHIFPLLRATWSTIYNIKSYVDNKLFSSNKLNVFKKGKILPGIMQCMLENVLMTQSMEPPYESVTLQQIYDLKLLQHSHVVPLSLLSFVVMMFHPRKITEYELEACNWEQAHVKAMFNGKLSCPVFHIKLQDSPEKGSPQKASKDPIKKLALSKNLVLAHVHTMVDEVIEILYKMKAANKSMQKCKMALTYSKGHQVNIIQKTCCAFWQHINSWIQPFPWHYLLPELDFELIYNLQLGD